MRPRAPRHCSIRFAETTLPAGPEHPRGSENRSTWASADGPEAGKRRPDRIATRSDEALAPAVLILVFGGRNRTGRLI